MVVEAGLVVVCCCWGVAADEYERQRGAAQVADDVGDVEAGVGVAFRDRHLARRPQVVARPGENVLVSGQGKGTVFQVRVLSAHCQPGRAYTLSEVQKESPAGTCA